MRIIKYIIAAGLLIFGNSCFAQNLLEKSMQTAMLEKNGTVIFMDIDSGEKIYFNRKMAKRRIAPCSTFKIWNTLIGVENKLISSSGKLFYKWDGKKYFVSAWNRDLTLKEAFQVSCVPAYQNLARRIGTKNMQNWINKIGYGNRDISSGVDIFWLPGYGRKSVLISPEEQVKLIRDLVLGNLSFSKKAKDILKEIMITQKTLNGTLYGKTGSGPDIVDKKNQIGWYVGYVISKQKRHAFACLLKGEDVSGISAKNVIIRILTLNRSI